MNKPKTDFKYCPLCSRKLTYIWKLTKKWLFIKLKTKTYIHCMYCNKDTEVKIKRN